MKLLLLMPDQLPQNLAAVRRAPAPPGLAEVMAQLDTRASMRRGSAERTDAAMLEALDAVPNRLPGMKLVRPETRGLADRRQRQHAIIDQFFGVYRVQGEAAEVFVHGLLLAYRCLIREGARSGTHLAAEHWGELAWSLEEALRFATGRAPMAPRPRDLPVGSATPDAHRRWRTGHQVFFPLVQAIIVALNCAQAALLGGRHDIAAAAFRLGTGLMRGSAAALRFASDFLAAEYAAEVRPSMVPPFTPEGLSGLMSCDHATMVRLFGQLGVLTAGLPSGLRGPYEGFVASTETTYEEHKGVCARFNGDRMVSLRMSASSPVTAVGVLEQIKQARIRQLRSQ